jgi:quinoprotein glucose dehydrogenase
MKPSMPFQTTRSRAWPALLVSVGAWTLAVGAAAPDEFSTWSDFEGNSHGSKYSSLSQINAKNVNQLEVAWTFETGAVLNAQPLLVDGKLIVAAAQGAVVALDPATGKALWRTPNVIQRGRMRGFTYWASKDGKDKRVIFPSGGKLIALDVVTGTQIAGFAADLSEGVDRPGNTRPAQSGSPPRVFENLLIVGSAVGEEYDSSLPGHIRAYDAVTGKLVWVFRTIPHPGEFGYETWPKDGYQRLGGANDWGGLTLDRKRGVVYVVTGSASYDFYGAERLGENLFANSLIALDARTGKRIWHFQAIHHDLWDYDNTNGPTLMSVRQNGKRVDAVVLATKSGLLFAFDRANGKPLWPIEEKPVPASDVPGEVASPTQPFQTKLAPFSRISFTEADLDPELPPAEKAYWTKVLRESRNEGLYTPPALRDTMQIPGNQGGANWGMSAAEPDSGRYYVMSYELPAFLKLGTGPDISFILQAEEEGGPGAGAYAANCQLCHGAERAGTPPAIPSLVGIGARMTDAQMKEAIRNAKAPMPSFAHLDDAEVEDLIRYLRAEGKPTGMPSTVRRFAQPSSVGPNGQTRYRSGFGFALSKAGNPIIRPPWATLSAYDMNKGDKLWTVPIGGIPGRPNAGAPFSRAGLAVTAGGLVFAASMGDRTLYGYDAKTGKVVWQKVLPSIPDGLPAVYAVGGREYIVWTVSNYNGQPQQGSTVKPAPGVNSYVAFALPKR